MKTKQVLASVAVVVVPSVALWVMGTVAEAPMRPELGSSEIALDSADGWSDDSIGDSEVATDFGDGGPLSELDPVDPGDLSDPGVGADSTEYPTDDLPIEEYPTDEFLVDPDGVEESFGWSTDHSTAEGDWDGEQSPGASPSSPSVPNSPAHTAPNQPTVPIPTAPTPGSGRGGPPSTPTSAVPVDLVTRCGGVHVARPDAGGWRNLTWTAAGNQEMNILGLGWNPARSIGVRVGSEAFWFSVSCGSEVETYVVGLCGAVVIRPSGSAAVQSATWTPHRHPASTMNVGGRGWSNAASVEFTRETTGTSLGLRCGDSQFVMLP